MRRHAAVSVGLIATLLICLQNVGFGLGLGWGVIHGAGPAALFALFPLAAGLGLLWGGFVFIRRRDIRHMPVVFALYAVCIMLLNEALLPTPLKVWRRQRAAEAVVVQNVRDEVFLSARGNPIGIRVTFEAVFPEKGIYHVSASSLSPVEGQAPYDLYFGHSIGNTIEPPPSASGPGERVFQADTVYTFTENALPNFISYNDRKDVLCLSGVPSPSFSEADLLDAVSKSRNMRYRTSIQVQGGYGSERIVAEEYTTSPYDLEAMYGSIAIEGNKGCGT